MDAKQLIQPKIEGEIAVVLERELVGPGITVADVTRAVGFCQVALEIIDSRIENWDIRAWDTIADNGSSARFVLGTEKRTLDGLKLAHLGMALSVNGEVVITASGAAVLGNPLHSVAFLANKLANVGKGIAAGSVVLTGSLGGMIPLKPAHYYACEIAELGCATIRTGRCS